MFCMGPIGLANLVYGAMPGGHGGAASLHIRDDEGPVATKTRDGSYHVAYVRLAHDPARPGAPPVVTLVYQETFSDAFKAGVEYQELVGYAPDVVVAEGEGLDSYRGRDLIERKLEEQEDSRRYLVEQYDDDLEAFGLKD